jgi:hypothetical protein
MLEITVGETEVIFGGAITMYAEEARTMLG